MTKLIKICGLRTEEAAVKAIDSGANLLGIILVPNRKRTIDNKVAKTISDLIKKRKISGDLKTVQEIFSDLKGKKFDNPSDYFNEVSSLIMIHGPFLVGVFRNQSVEEVFQLANELELDFIQLHGNENKEEYLNFNKDINFGIIPRYVIPKDIGLMTETFGKLMNFNGFSIPLLDSEVGGEGKAIDWNSVNSLNFGKFILAGGLNPSNLLDTKAIDNVIGYDVSGGVEDNQGNKDLLKIEQFINIGKTI